MAMEVRHNLNTPIQCLSLFKVIKWLMVLFLQAVNVKAAGIIQQLFNQSTEKIEAT